MSDEILSPSEEVLNEQALQIDATPPDGSKQIPVEFMASTTALVFARAALDKLVDDIVAQHEYAEDAMWVTWPHRKIIVEITKALDAHYGD